MPIYEYRCASCDHKSTFFTRSIYAEVQAICQKCGSVEMERVISRVTFRTTGRTTGRTTSGNPQSAEYYSDPSNIGRYVEDSFTKYGVDMPESVRETIDDARRGKMPDGLEL